MSITTSSETVLPFQRSSMSTAQLGGLVPGPLPTNGTKCPHCGSSTVGLLASALRQRRSQVVCSCA